MRVLVCGGRNFRDRRLMAMVLASYRPADVINDVSDAILILGGAPGAVARKFVWHSAQVRMASAFGAKTVR